MEIEIREYQPSDQDACLKIMLSNIPEYCHEQDLPDFTRFLGKLPGPYFVVTHANAGVIACGGIAFGRITSTEAILCYGMVTRDQLHQGIGLQLLRKRLEFFLPNAPQVERILVKTTQKTEGFFHKFGFSVLERELNGFGTELDRVSMMANKEDVLRLLTQRKQN